MAEEKIKLLIVDDEEIINVHIKSYLEKRPYMVFTAGSAEEALPLIKRENLALMLLDLALPGMSGIDLVKEVRKFNPGLKVILISGYYNLDSIDPAEWKELNILEFVRKPMGIVELELIIKKALAKE